MNKILKDVNLKLRSTPAFLLFVLATYIFFVFVSMAPGVMYCGDTVSGLGDNTGGPIWRASITPEQPLLGGYQQKTNYPYGENLYSPVGYAAYLQTVIMKGATKIVGPVCAYNVLNIAGFLSSALIMFAFVYYLLKNKWIAWLAGYAVAFTPYVQSKIGGHPSYGYVSILILLLWSLLLIMQKKKYCFGALLGGVLAVCGYFDPYFILFSLTILIPTLIVWFLYSGYQIRKKNETFNDFTKTFKVLLFASLVTLVLLAPLVYIRLSKSAEITSTTSSIRGDTMAAAMQCSNLPLDYLLPDPYNLTYGKIFGQEFIAKNISYRRWCGTGESRVAISIVMVLIIAAAVFSYVIKARNKRNKSPRILSIDKPALIIGIIVFIGLTAFLLGLPPKIGGLPMPSWFVIKLTDMWRIFAREYLVLNMAVVLLFSIALSYLDKSFFKNRRKIATLCFGIIAALIFLEYQFHDPFRPFTFSYKRDVPSIYNQIKNDDSVKALAEYPLDRLGIESDAIVYYTTMQAVHNKPILNSSIALNPNEKLHNSIKDLSDPQTVPILRTLGISHITVHGIQPDELYAKTDQLDILKVETPPVYGLTMIRSAPTNTIIYAKIKDGPKLDTALVVKKGFTVNQNIMKDPFNMEYEIVPDPLLGIVKLGGEGSTAQVCFDIKMSSHEDSGFVHILIDGERRETFSIDGAYKRVKFSAGSEDEISLDIDPDRNIRLNNLGCQTGE